MSDNFIKDEMTQKFGDISSSNLVKPMVIFDPEKALKKFEKSLRKKDKKDVS